jgi:D-glycero-alpha-D-manno-heptose 1-phosphate guanylyltransferase
MTTLILVGGLGTRLRGVLPDLPKPMAPVRGRPFLEYLLADLRRAGLQHIVLCVGHKAEKIEAHFGDGEKFGVHLEYSREHELLGTAGALKLAQAKIKSENFLLLNGDCYNQIDYAALLAQHGSTPALATLAATRVEDRARFGSLKIDGEQHVVGFEEKGAATGAGWINAGYYALHQSVLELIPNGAACSLEREIFPRLMESSRLFAFQNEGAFIDIGLPEDWRRAEKVLPF